MKLQHLVLMFSALSAGCAAPIFRGEFALLSTTDISEHADILTPDRVAGKACYNLIKSEFQMGQGVFDAALQDALSKHEGATILIDPEFVDTGYCVEVSGIPATL